MGAGFDHDAFIEERAEFWHQGGRAGVRDVDPGAARFSIVRGGNAAFAEAYNADAFALRSSGVRVDIARTIVLGERSLRRRDGALVRESSWCASEGGVCRGSNHPLHRAHYWQVLEYAVPVGPRVAKQLY